MDELEHFEPQKQQRAYWLALGKFVGEYAEMEATLFIALRVMSKVPKSTAKAVFSGVRVDAATKTMSRLLEVGDEPQPLKDAFRRVFVQISLINEVRNSILHYGVVFRLDEDAISSNSLVALDATRLREFPVSVEILANMGEDLQAIQAHFTAYFLGLYKSLDTDLQEILEASKRRRDAPWKYTRPTQAATTGRQKP